MTPSPSTSDLRRLVFGVAVLDDLDVLPADDGVLLPGAPDVEVPWELLLEALGDGPARAPLTVAGRLLREIRALSDLGVPALRRRVRPLGVAAGSATHPGEAWICSRVPGDALHLGLGFVGLGEDPDAVRQVLPHALKALGVEPRAWWVKADNYLEHMGAAAASRLAELTAETRNPRAAVLRPMGDADVLTLLGSRAYRQALAQRDGSGLCAVAVPMRRRGWIDLRALDPAFVPAAAAATDSEERGFSRVVLVSADEVVLARDQG